MHGRVVARTARNGWPDLSRVDLYISKMTIKVSAKEARERLSELLDRATRGEEVVILRHGKPVVRLAPLRAAKAARQPDLREFRASLRVRGVSLTEHLLKERQEERE